MGGLPAQRVGAASPDVTEEKEAEEAEEAVEEEEIGTCCVEVYSCVACF